MITPASDQKIALTTIPENFKRQVARYPDQIAIKSDKHTWSYQQLNQRANQIGVTIRRAIGEATQCRIALLLDHDADLIAAILAVLKLGNIYIPLDPDYPVAHSRYMLANAGVRLLVVDATNRKLANELKQDQVETIDLDRLDEADSAVDIQINLNSDDLAYILFTSGSTGQPKGVMQTHAGLLHHVANYVGGLGIEPCDKLTLFYSCCFSASLMDIFGALLTGATIYPHYLKKYAIHSLVAWLDKEGITVFHSTPTVFRQFCQSLTTAQTVARIRIIDVAGEPLYSSDVALFKQHFNDDCILMNHFACTEASVCAQYPMHQHTPIDGNLVGAGHPVAGVKVTIVDDDGNPTTTGVTGEIVIQSRYLAPGYWQLPELTEATFGEAIDGSGERLFYTGDLGSMAADGSLTHLGRKDARVKIRGYSVELAEVEGTLRKHPSIKDAIVVVDSIQQGHRRLIAYFVTKISHTLSSGQLRQFMQSTLADYMIPAFFIALDRLPVTPNGKIDKRALPRLDRQQLGLDDGYLAPRNAIEEQLQTIWQETLDITPIGMRDSFQELGGDSLLAVQLLIAVERHFGRYFPLSTLLDAENIEQIVPLIEQSQNEGWSALVPIRNQGSHHPLLCIHCGRGHLYRYKELADALDLELPVFGIQPLGLDGKQPLQRSVKALATSYNRLLAQSRAKRPALLAGYSFGGLVAYEMACQAYHAGHPIELLILLDSPVFANYGLSKKKVSNHVDALRALNLRQKIEYLGGKTKGHIQGKLHEIRHCFDRLYGNLRLALGCPIPIAKRGDYFAKISFQATRAYTPKPYAGRVLLFTTTSYAAETWQSLCQGPIEMHHLDCSHEELLYAPNIAKVAQHIEAALQQLSLHEEMS